MAKAREILIVEDSVPDYEAIVRAFKKTNINNPVFHCETGEEALNFLYRASDAQKALPCPSLILLDLNLPGINGRNVLKKIKSDERLKSIPVIILTTSDSEKDIEECYKNGANSYITKPVDWEKLLESMHAFKAFWLQTAVLPNKESFI